MKQQILVLSDLHAPDHDKKSLDLFIKVAKSIKPDVLVCIGDLWDGRCVSKWRKNPSKEMGFMAEMKIVHKVLDRLDPLAPRKVFLCGNHEKRLEDYILDNASALSDYVTIESVLNLEERGWEYYPYQEPVKIGRVGFVHDLGGYGVNATREMTGKFPRDAVFGHTHRLNCFTRGNLEHYTYTAWNCGWLGDPKKINYRSSVHTKQDWIKGFVLVTIDDKGTAHFEGVKINKGRCMVNGKLYE